jgi:hypothetical protein
LLMDLYRVILFDKVPLTKTKVKVLDEIVFTIETNR